MDGDVAILFRGEFDVFGFVRLRNGSRHGTLIFGLRSANLNHVGVEGADQNRSDHFQVVGIPGSRGGVPELKQRN